jgi:hypothetical protein
MRSTWFAVVTMTLSCAVMAGCGGATKRVDPGKGSAGAASSPGYLVRDADEDYDNAHGTGARYDHDDSPDLYYGHIADAKEAAAITELVQRYYAAAAAGNGAVGCAQLFSPIAESLPEEYAASPTNGPTCAAVLTKVFIKEHAQYALRHATLEVTSVRVEGGHGFAMLRFKDTPDHHLRVRREGGRWTVHQLLDEGLP